MRRRWLAAHTTVALGVTLVATALWLALPVPGDTTRLALLAGLVAVLGLPHGAVDHLQGRALLARRYGRRWFAVFAAGYTLAAAAVIGAWIAWPPALLIGFLLLAMAHFGAEDAAAAPRTTLPAGRARTWLDAALRGAVPVVLPITFWPARTGDHFAALLPSTPADPVIGALATLAPAGWMYLGALGLYAAASLAVGARQLAAELGGHTAAFAVLPPLIAFTVYFCIWHAPRHSLAVIASRGPARLGAGIAWFARAALPLTLVTIAIAGVAWASLRQTAHADAATLQVVFIGLAALTVPHVALGAWHRVAIRRS